MKYEEWEPYYLEILDSFSFSLESDEKAAVLLSNLLKTDSLQFLKSITSGNDVTVCGNAPSLINELNGINGIIFAADRAALVLFYQGIRPDVIITDLDGANEEFINMNNSGTIIVVHAHGDNIPLLSYWVPRFSGPVVGTTQSRPFGSIYNFGGFSDGDRGVFCAYELGAKSVKLKGFDPDDPKLDEIKHKKLQLARKLLLLFDHVI